MKQLESFLANHRGMERRTLLRAGLGVAIAAVMAPIPRAFGQSARPTFTADPFALGVASGYPHASGFTLWTRLVPEPLAADGGMWFDFVNVDWEVAEDDKFAKPVASGYVRTVPELAHSVHVDVTGLRPDRWYFYRFTCGQAVSRTGRTRTMPSADASPDRLRVAFGSCQHFQQSWFSAHRHIMAEEPDLMMFLGDYIYESNWGTDPVRKHHGDEAYSLADYRIRHAQYKTDTDLQDHHALVPFVYCWDDHEVDNDYADWRSEHLDPQFLLRRAAAYQAFYEHQPVPRHMVPRGADMHIYTHLDFGRLARVYLLDNRQYRTVQPCPNPAKGGGSTDITESCKDAFDPKQTLLGKTQERWLSDRFDESRARFNLIAQQTIFGRFDSAEPGRTRFTDGWDGYPIARSRLLADVERTKLANPVILGGDIHATAVTHVRRDPDNEKSPILAPEFCGTSIASQGWDDVAGFNARKTVNPDLLHADTTKRGYTVLDVTPSGIDVRLRTIDNEKLRDSGVSTDKQYRVTAGKPLIESA